MLANSIPKVLIVDDERSNVLLLAKTLAQGNEVFTASNGAEALQFAHAHEPDIILLDVIMPGIDGFEVCRQLKADDRLKDIPVIFVSSLDDTRDEALGLELGAIDYITKPISPGIVRARVKNHLELKRSRDLLARLSQIDGLTGIANRRAFDEQIETELRRMKRAESPLSVILIDIDHFKQYNDTYGHIAEDGCLRRVAQTLSDTLGRAEDFIARFGREEFVCLLPGLEGDRAADVAERLRKSVESAHLEHESSTTGDVVTISVGVASVGPDEETSAEGILEKADTNLYKAKDTGRNRVQAG